MKRSALTWWPTLPWLPTRLWLVWRDATWARKPRIEFLAKMQRYYTAGGQPRAMAIERIKALIEGADVWEWDDNVPVEWANELATRWGLRRK